LNFENGQSNLINLEDEHKPTRKSKLFFIYLLASKFEPLLVMEVIVKVKEHFSIDKVNEAISNIAVILNK